MKTILILFLIASIWYLAQLAIYLCAKLGVFWMIKAEGNAVAIIHNKKFHKMLLQYTGHQFRGHLKNEDNEVDNLEIYNIEISPNATAFPSFFSGLFSIIFPIKGISWIGIPPFYKAYEYTFKWTDDKFVEREPENLKWILVQKYVYGLILDKVELEGGIPYTIRLLVTLQITNPAKALFRVKRWLDASLERISGWARDEFSSLSIDDFLSPTAGNKLTSENLCDEKRLDNALQKILQSSKNQLTPQFGVSVDIIQVVKIDPSDEKLREIIIKKEVAKQTALAAMEEAIGRAEANRTEAKGRADANKTEAEGEAEAIRIVNEEAKKMDDKAVVLKGFDAIKNAGANVTVIGKGINPLTMINIPTTKKGGSE